MDRLDAAPRILSSVSGRIRVHLPVWSREQAPNIEARLMRLAGVWEARANPLTGNVLVRFDPPRLNCDALLALLATIQQEFCAASPADHPVTRHPMAKAVFRGVVGHAVVDVLLYGATASGYAFGWGWIGRLGMIHLFLDVFVWGIALRPLVANHRRLRGAVAGPSGRAPVVLSA